MTRSRGSVPQLIAALLVSAATVTLTVVALQPAAAPNELRDVASPKTAQVIVEDFVDSRSVSVDFSSTPPPDVTSPRDGVITGTTCAAGGAIASGTVPLEISGERILALYLSVPPWRTFDDDADGPDVASLQAELARLGYPTSNSGYWDSATLSALNDLQEAQAVEPSDATLSLSDFLWLPAPSVAVLNCPAVFGSKIQPGATFATLRPTITGAKLEAIPEALVPGARVLKVGDVTVAVDPSGAVLDPQQVVALANAPEAAATIQTLNSEAPTPLNATFTLASAISAASIPAAAVKSTEAGSCVFDAESGAPQPVSVLSSSLGQTIVQFAGNPPLEVATRLTGKQSC